MKTTEPVLLIKQLSVIFLSSSHKTLAKESVIWGAGLSEPLQGLVRGVSIREKEFIVQFPGRSQWVWEIVFGV